jgi:murein DD-endopeptidase MepM/ murein hydrolase activator NlpD
LALNDSRIIFVPKDNSKVKQIIVSRKRLFFFTTIFLTLFLVVGKYSLDFIIDFSYDSKVKSLEQSNGFLKNQLSKMSKKIENINNLLAQVEDKDDEVRMYLGVPELNADLRDVGIGGANYDYNISEKMVDPQVAEDLNDQLVVLDKLEREVKLELNSFNELINTYHAKEDTIKHMPALHPVLGGRVTSNFGRRLHPIFKIYLKHPGIDFAAKAGTPIYAAADGIIKLAKHNGGYGKCVFIDHLFGFETRYGHMQKILARRGQRVKRGDKIGLVGKTGIATAPHLHFEVHYKGKEVNPRHYFFDDESLNQAVVEKM